MSANTVDPYKLEKSLKDLSQRNSTKECYIEIKDFLEPILENEKRKKIKRDLRIVCTYDSYDALSEISRVCNTFNNTINYYERAVLDLERLNAISSDILHEIELLEKDENEILILYKELKEVRIERRRIKNFLNMINPLVNFVNNNKNFIKQFNQIHSQIEKLNKNVLDQQYNPRVKEYREEEMKVFKKIN